MRNLRGIIVAAVFAGLTILVKLLGERFNVLLGMAYPFASKTYMELVGSWTGKFDVCVWQVILVVFCVAVIASIGLMILNRWNFLRWLGWVLAPMSVAYFLLTLVWGLNYSNKPIHESMKLEVSDWSVSDLREATDYYLDLANQYAKKVDRDGNGDLRLQDMDSLNETLAQSYDNLVWKYSVFAGSRGPVKALSWSDVCSSMGCDGVTVGLTGEAAVNTNQYSAVLPFTMCHEVAHLLAFAREDEANFAGYLACEFSADDTFRYSGYLKAFLYCADTLYEVDAGQWKEVWQEAGPELRHDVEAMNEEYARWKGKIQEHSSQLYNAYLTSNGQENGVESYSDVTGLLVAWYVDQYRPDTEPEEPPFNPLDYNEVFPTEETTAPTEP
ncbi:MAG: DUF3810 domain-containing protein [Faecousia sp.]